MTDSCDACKATDPADRRPRPERYGGGRCQSPFHGEVEPEECEAIRRRLEEREQAAKRAARPKRVTRAKKAKRDPALLAARAVAAWLATVKGRPTPTQVEDLLDRLERALA